MTTVVPLSLRPIVNWVRVDNGSNVVSSAVTQITPTTTLVTLSLKPSLHDTGTYRCIADLSIPMVTSFHIEQNYNLYVRREYYTVFIFFGIFIVSSFQAVLRPKIEMVSDGPERFFIPGANRTITCTASLTNVDDILTVNLIWTWLATSFNMVFKTHNTSYYKNQSTFTSHLSFNLLNESVNLIFCQARVYFFDRFVAQRSSVIILHRKYF